MKRSLFLLIVIFLAYSTSIYSQGKKDPRFTEIDKQIQNLKSEIANQKSEIDNQKSEIENLKKYSKRIFTKTVLLNSYYDANGNRLAPSGTNDSEVKIEFPDNYFTQKPEIILAIRGWSYTGKLAADNSMKWEGESLQEWWPLGPNWVKTVDVTKNFCKVRAFLYERNNMNDNVILVDVVAVGQ